MCLRACLTLHSVTQVSQIFPLSSDIVNTHNISTWGIGMPKRYDLEKFSNSKNLQTSNALEFIMRDVIDGMEELANMSGFSPNAGGLYGDTQRRRSKNLY